MNNIQIKYEHIPGLEPVVHEEIIATTHKEIEDERKGVAYTEYVEDISALKALKSVNNIYYSKSKFGLTPVYLRKNIAELFAILDIVISSGNFGSYNLSCAGDDSKDVRSIKNQISQKYKIPEKEKADLQINLGRVADIWELSVRLTARPLSLREWRTKNIEGGLNPTIAYAMNFLSEPKGDDRYLNIFSGSGTLLIERTYWPAKEIVGFDNDGLFNSYAAENARNAGVLKQISLTKHDIYDSPDLGKFDVITANLPFGIQQSKGEDLSQLYSKVVEYALASLNDNGRIILYTTQIEQLNEVLANSRCKVVKELPLEIFTSAMTLLTPAIYVVEGISS